MKPLTVLRFLAGLALIGVGVWIFLLALPALYFILPTFFLAGGLYVIEAPRFQRMWRQDRERLATYAEKNESAAATIDRSARLGRLSWILYVVGIGCAALSFPLSSVHINAALAAIGVGVIIMTAGFVLGLYRTFAKTSVRIRAFSEANPRTTRKQQWAWVIAAFAAVIVVAIADSLWRVDLLNWLCGALAIWLIGIFLWRWKYGWPEDSA